MTDALQVFPGTCKSGSGISLRASDAPSVFLEHAKSKPWQAADQPRQQVRAADEDFNLFLTTISFNLFLHSIVTSCHSSFTWQDRPSTSALLLLPQTQRGSPDIPVAPDLKSCTQVETPDILGEMLHWLLGLVPCSMSSPQLRSTHAVLSSVSGHLCALLLLFYTKTHHQSK